MNEKITAQYDSLYSSQSDMMYGNGEPIKAVVRLPKYLKSGTVLDVGGGEGRNALYLARNGFQMTVTDLSTVGLAKLQAFAAADNLHINTHVADATASDIKEYYDGIVFSFVLHHIHTNNVYALLKQAKEHTHLGGVHVIATFSNQGALADRNQDKSRFYPTPESLSAAYADWHIRELATKETTTKARDKAGNRLKNGMITLIAQKPY